MKLTFVKDYNTFINEAENFHECMRKLDKELYEKGLKRCGRLHVKSLQENCWLCEMEVMERGI